MVTWNCTEFESQLQQCLDARRPLSSVGVSAGAIRCPHCRALWDRFLLLEQALAGWRCDSADGDFSEAVVARVLLDSEPSFNERAESQVPGETRRRPGPHLTPHRREVARPSRRRGRRAAVAAAGVVLLASLVPLLREPENRVAGPPRESDQRIAQDTPPGQTHDGDPAAQRDLQFLLRDAGTAYRVLADEAGAAVADATRLVPTAFPQRGGPGDAAASDAAPEWIDDWRRDLKPIGEDVHKALSFLFDAVAVEEDTSI